MAARDTGRDEKIGGPERTRLALKVVPGASRDGIAGWVGEALKVRVRQPPERGRANAAVIGLLAKALGVERARVRIVQGTTSPRKVAEIEGLDDADVRARLGAGSAGGSDARS